MIVLLANMGQQIYIQIVKNVKIHYMQIMGNVFQHVLMEHILILKTININANVK